MSSVSPPSTSQEQHNFTTMVTNASSLLGKSLNSFNRPNNNVIMKQQQTVTSCGNIVPSSSTFAFASEKLTTTVSSPSFLSTSGNSRAYTRVLSNIRSLNVLPGQNISLADGSTILNPNGTGLKRIRILTAIPNSKASTMLSGNARYDSNADLGLNSKS
jgi:hypothetical protein